MNLVVNFLVFFVSKEPASVFAQLSLKEGLTVFRDPEFSSDVGSSTVKRIADVLKLRIYQYPQEFISKAITLPGEGEIMDMMEVADPDAVHAVRNFIRMELASALKEEFLNTVKHNHSSELDEFNHPRMARHALKNIALAYLGSLEDPEVSELALNEYRLATNMTEQFAAFVAIEQKPGEIRDQVLPGFYKKGQHDFLVVNKWFALQAASDIPGNAANVNKLLEHPAFDLRNSNKVYSLIGGFCGSRVNFHAKDGSGYKFLGEIVVQLAKLNPQVASRMVSAFSMWKRFDETRQNLAKAQVTCCTLSLEWREITCTRACFDRLIRILKNHGTLPSAEVLIPNFGWLGWGNMIMFLTLEQVVNKWFALQAASDIPGNVANVKKLLEHPAFDLRNPNKAYSLIGGFCGSHVNFHAKDGSGYKFLGEIVVQLDKLNHQVASRMVSAFSRWKRFDETRRNLAKAQDTCCTLSLEWREIPCTRARSDCLIMILKNHGTLPCSEGFIPNFGWGEHDHVSNFRAGQEDL